MRLVLGSVSEYIIVLIGVSGLLGIRFKDVVEDVSKNVVSNKISYLLKSKYITSGNSLNGKVYRLTKKGEKFLKEINEEIYNFHQENYSGKKISYTNERKTRLSLNSEFISIMLSVDIKVDERSIVLDNILNGNKNSAKYNKPEPKYYTSRFIKNSIYEQAVPQRINISRFIGMLVTNNNIFVTYNFPSSYSTWKTRNEITTQLSLDRYANKLYGQNKREVKIIAVIREQNEILSYITNYNKVEEQKTNGKNYKITNINYLGVSKNTYLLPIQETESKMSLQVLVKGNQKEILVMLLGEYAIKNMNIGSNQYGDIYDKEKKVRYIQVIDNNLTTYKNLMEMQWLYQGEEETVIICLPYQEKLLNKIKEKLQTNKDNKKVFHIYTKNIKQIVQRSVGDD